MSVNCKQIVSITLDSYEVPEFYREKGKYDLPQSLLVQEVVRKEVALSDSPKALLDSIMLELIVISNISHKFLFLFFLHIDINWYIDSDTSKSPSYWSKVCVHNMAKLAKEATTLRRVSESLFRVFDTGSHWTPDSGIALPVLSEMQILMEKSG